MAHPTAFASAAICLLASSAFAQSITGVVRDSSGAGVPDADVSIVSARKLVRTDTAGRFELRRLDAGTMRVSIRRLGFEPRSFDVELRRDATETLTVVLVAQPAILPGMVVDEHTMRRRMAIEDFYRRRAIGSSGRFVTREDIEERHTSRLSDVLRDVPGLIFSRARGGGMSIRFATASIQRRDCEPDYWVDGQRVTHANVDDFPARDVEGVEVYNGPAGTPMQFSQGAISTCGTIVIWSRVPGT